MEKELRLHKLTVSIVQKEEGEKLNSYLLFIFYFLYSVLSKLSALRIN